MGESKKLKKELLLKLETLEAVGEENMDETTWRERYEIEARMDQELIKDEMYWQQRGAPGDANTSFFHMCANGRRRKTRICSLDTENGTLSDQKDISQHIVEFYKKFFWFF
jgi:hypothetical protein